MEKLRNLALILFVAVFITACGAGGGGTNVTVSDVGNVEGTVTGASSSVALSGVTVQIGDKTAPTGTNGVYSITDLAVGSRTITATKSGYQDYNGTVTVTKGTTVIQNIQMILAGTSDTTPPTVSSVDPASNATDVAVNKVITVTFSEAMDCSTITTSFITLKDNLNAPVTGTISSCNSATAVFTPSSNLSYSTLYTAAISTSVKDAAGNAMASNYSWSFSTGTGATSSWTGTKQFGSSSDDAAMSTATDKNGNVYVAGYTWGSIDGNTYAGGNDIFLVKYNTSGIKQWIRQIGTGGLDGAAGVATDSNGNIYLTGWTGNTGTWTDSTGIALDGNTTGPNNMFVIKYDTNGTKQWTRLLGTSSTAFADNPTSIATDSSSNVYVAGNTNGGLDGNTSVGGSDLFVVKYDTNGAKQWTKQFGTTAADGANGVATDSIGNVYVAGWTGGGLDGNTSAGADDIYVVKYDTNGVKQWTRQLGTASSELADGVATDSNGNIYVAGVTNGGLDGNANAGAGDLYVAKYDTNGVKQWTRQLGTISDEFTGDVATDSAGNVYVAGGTGGSLDGNTFEGAGDLYVVKYDTNGVKQWTRQRGTSYFDGAYGVATDINGNIYLVGYTFRGLDGNTYAGTGADVFVAKYDANGVKQ